MRRISLLILIITLFVWLPAKADGGTHAAKPATTFVVLRHAEKASDDPRDPQLTEAGRQRAEQIAEALSQRELNAVFSSDYRRTRETAAVSASRHGLTTTLYDPRESAETFAERLQAEHAGGLVLVVGHSNTVPALVAALCRCAIEPIDESDYGNWFEVRIDGDQRLLQQQRY